MENPEGEVERVVNLLIRATSPDVQQAAVRKYFTSDAGFRNPMCSVEPAANSREGVLGVYQCYRVMSTYIELSVNHITYDAERSILFLDISQVFHMRYSPFPPARARLLTRLRLREQGGRHYITSQEDFYHPDDLFATILPPLAKLVDLMLRIGGFACGLSARLAQAVFGVWTPRRDN